MWLKALLFFLLSPGVLLTIPAGSRGLWMSGQTSIAAAAVHAIVFVLVWKYIMGCRCGLGCIFGCRYGCGCGCNTRPMGFADMNGCPEGKKKDEKGKCN